MMILTVDCWNGVDGPVVFHGNTLTGKVPLGDVLDTIREFAFATSEYPLILHLENHCSPEGQKEVVALLESKLGDLIYATPHGDALFTAKHSPQSLKGKILIKVTNHFEAAVKLTCTLQGGHCNMANSYCKILS